ncbi:MAG TPA: alpha-2-macroglobulin family protein [Gemmataceae bacterium]|nr:alpha-2-macroglobulin family protein [Gemmataceae bacterium]
MHPCPSCQAQMLEFLYDLLDAADRQAMQNHLDGCAPCQAQLETARRQQNLLAAAARMEFPAVQFAAPSEAMAGSAPAVVPLPAPVRRKVLPWRRWAAAAAIFLAIGGLAVPGWWAQRDYADACRAVEQNQTRKDAAAKQMKEAVAQSQVAPEQAEQKIAAVRHAALADEFRVSVVGQQTKVDGESSTYEVQTTDLNGQPIAAGIDAYLADAAGQRIGDKIAVSKSEVGKYGFTLPADIPETPDNRMTLVVSTWRDGVASARREVLGRPVQVSGEVDLTPPIYITHLETDKPMYQPGEVVHFRSLTLDRSSLKPAEEPLRLTYELVTPKGARRILAQGNDDLLDEDGAVVFGPDKKPMRGVGVGEVVLDPNMEGGEYTLICRDDGGRFAEQQRKFIVNNYPKPQLNKQLDFGRSTYGPGDEVAAVCKASWAAGGVLANQPVEATVMIDGKKYGGDPANRDALAAAGQPLRFQTDPQGQVVVRFKLPPTIERGEASLGVKFVAVPETITRPVPIVLKKLDVEFYPEGGDLAADVPNRVYFQVRTPLGKPADLTGVLLEDGRPLPVVVETMHDEKEPGVNQGMGRFEFAPKSGKTYSLRIDSPVGITDAVALPKPRDDRAALRVADGAADPGRPIHVTVQSKTKRNLMVCMYCRGRLLQSAPLQKDDKSDTKYEANLNPESTVGGVCRVTVFEEKTAAPNQRELTPIAERLIYRRPTEKLAVRLSADQPSYVPGQPATLHVEADNEAGAAVPSVALVAVVDKSVLTMADEKTYRSMPTHFLLTSEVQRAEDLEYADFLLGQQPKAAETLDLLLGVQGWRHFTTQDPAKPREPTILNRDEAERLLVMSGQSTPRRAAVEQEQQEIKKIRQETESRIGALKEQYDQAAADEKAVGADPAFAAASVKRASYETLLEKVRTIGAPLIGAGLLLAALACLAVGLWKGGRRGVSWYAAAAASAGLMVVSAVVAVQSYRPGAPNGPAPTDDLVAWVDKFATVQDAPAGAAEIRDQEGTEGPAADGSVTAANGQAGTGGGGAMTFTKPAAGLPSPTSGTANGPARPTDVPPPPAAAMPQAPAGGLGAAVRGGADKGAGGDAAKNERFADADDDRKNLDDLAKRMGLAAPRDLPREQEQIRLENGMEKKADLLDRAPDQKDRAEGKDLKQAQQNAQRALFERNLATFNANRLREQAAFDGKPAGRPAPIRPLIVREYAHSHNEAAELGLRSDFAETLCWRPVLVLPDGKADVSFEMSDSITTFQATAFVHTLDGRLGAAVLPLESRLPFTLQATTPIEATASDTIAVPLTVSNNTSARRDVRLTLAGHDNLQLLDGKETDRFGVDGEKKTRPIYRFQPTVKEGDAVLTFAGQADSFAADAERRRFHIVPEGFPVAESHSDLLEGSASQTVELPDSWVKGTLKCRVQVFPSTLADLQSGLESLLREPNGCFEQTSTSNYPNVLILDYLKESEQAKPEVERRAREMLARGYQRLTSFECSNAAKGDREGYEWFGGTAPPHEALTAYGLLEFRDMARVQDVDAAMLKRTTDYLMSRRDEKGGFLRNPRALDSFGRAPDDVTNAYIVWALTESGKDDDLTVELNALAAQAKSSKDPYFLSLVANSLINRARTDEATGLLKTVASEQKEDGHLDAEKTSITGSGGRDLQIETTALAVLGWLKANPGTFNDSLRKAVAWIGKQRGGYGGFGSTQSTILALKALIAYTRANKRTAEGGELRLFVGDKEAAKLAFPAGAADALTLELQDSESVLRPGKNGVRIEVTGKNTFPYTLAWSYSTLTPVPAADCPVRLTAALSETKAQEGDLVRLNVTLENVSGKGQGMATAVIGLPGGLTLPEDLKQLKQYCREPEDGSRPLVSAFEIRGRELVLYWRDLAPDQKIEVPLDVIARVPGEYSGPASRGYLYYNADHKDWVAPLHVTIAAKAE